MGNPNFLSANISGIELMPGVNDDAVGYDVNRIIQALNGTNIVPITTGDLTVKGNETISGTLLVTGAVTFSSLVGPITINPGPLTVGANPPQSNALISARIAGNGIEFGHQNPAGYGSTIGSEAISGIPFLAFNSEAGSTGNTFRTRGISGSVLESDLAGGFVFKTVATASADNQTATSLASLTTGGLLTVANGLTITAGGETITAGDLAITAGKQVFGAAVSQIVPGATSLSLRNNANNADNLILTDAGLITLRNALKIPPSAGGTVAATSYGTVPVKIDEKTSGSAFGSADFTSIPSGFRHLLIEFQARSDQAGVPVECGIQFNADGTAGHYTWQRLTAASTTVVGQDGSTTAGSIAHIYISGTNSPSGMTGVYRVWIPYYASTVFNKMARIDGGYYAGTGYPQASVTSFEAVFGTWVGTAAINEVKVFPAAGNFMANSIFTLYGIP